MGGHPEPHATGPVEESESSSDDDAARLVAAAGLVVSSDQLLEAAKTNPVLTASIASAIPKHRGVECSNAAGASTVLPAVSWKAKLDSAVQTLDGVQLKVAAQLDKILKSSIEFRSQTEGCSAEQLADSSSKHAARDSSLGRLFHDAVATAGGQFRVSWQSEYTASQIQTPEDAMKAVKLYRRKRQRFSGLQALRRHVTWESFPTCDAAKIDWVRNKWVFATPGTSGTMNRSKCAVGMQGKHIEAVVVTGDQVTAYAALASGTAVKRMRPVSKQENLGPKRIARCGWGGGTSPLEALSIQLRNQR